MASDAENPLPTSAVLMAISKHIAARLGKVNRAYMHCKDKDANPESCLAEGDAVTAGVVNLLKELNSKAPTELKEYYTCLDYYSNKFDKCRKEQKAFEEAAPVS